MPSEYRLKRPVIDLNRLKKMVSKSFQDGEVDRQLALDTLKYFKDLVEIDSTDDTSKKCMTDCIKLAQSAKANLTKIVDLIIRIEELEDRRSNSNTYGKSNQNKVNFFKELENDKQNV
jgi:hypothetical protein